MTITTPDEVDPATAYAELAAREPTFARLLTEYGEVDPIGVWSAQMFLLHQLRRTDILPAGDVGIRRAVERLWGYAELPAIKEVEALGATWSPYRTFAAALLWRSLS